MNLVLDFFYSSYERMCIKVEIFIVDCIVDEIKNLSCRKIIIIEKFENNK